MEKEDSKIVLYTTGCPRCSILKQKLDQKGVSYSVVTDMNEMLSRGISMAPMLEVGDTMLGFTEAVVFVNSLPQPPG